MPPSPTTWSPTIAASNARRVFDFGLSRGVEPADLDAIHDPAQPRIPARRMFALWRQLGAALDAAAPIQVAERFSLDDLQLLGFVIGTAPTVREGLEAFVKYGALLSDAFVWSLEIAARTIDVRWHCRVPRDAGVCISLETSIAQVVQGVRQLAGADIDPLRVEFAHAAPHRTAAHRAFFRCKIDWDGRCYRVIFPRHVLDTAPRQASPALFRYLCAEAELSVRALVPQPLVARVRDEVARSLWEGRIPQLSELAPRLGMSERTLRRRLAEQSIGYRKLVDSERRERARELLERRDASVTRVALELGFADVSALSHACRRWFARSPAQLTQDSVRDARGLRLQGSK
jgi:AraC-like DNA-binding protein